MPYCVSQEACACLYVNSAIVVAFPLAHARVHCYQAEDAGHGRLFLLLSRSGPPSGTPGDVAEGITVTPQPRDYCARIFKDVVTAAQCSTTYKYTHEQEWDFCRVRKGLHCFDSLPSRRGGGVLCRGSGASQLHWICSCGASLSRGCRSSKKVLRRLCLVGMTGFGKIRAILFYEITAPKNLISIVLSYYFARSSSFLLISSPSLHLPPTSFLSSSVVSQPNHMLKVMGHAGGQGLIAAGATEPGQVAAERILCDATVFTRG